MTKKKNPIVIPSTDVQSQEFAERHMAAYMYSLTNECNCPACVALRPLAKTFYEKFITKKKEVSSSGNSQGASQEGA